MKTCTSCLLALETADFCKHAGRKDGLSTVCRACKKTQARKHYESNKDTILAKNKKYWEDRPGLKQKQDREYHAKHRAEHLVTFREYRKNMPAAVRQRCIEAIVRWQAANKESVREAGRRLRARAAGVQLAWFDVEQLLARLSVFGGCCAYCRGPLEHIDHLKPLADKGPHILANLRPSCGSCNTRKGRTAPAVWLAAHSPPSVTLPLP